jgi:serine/threonine protein kinase
VGSSATTAHNLLLHRNMCI